ncbi:hypothetical protein M569_14549, partial [Genlisea aurea]
TAFAICGSPSGAGDARNHRRITVVRCGKRDNRPQLSKGRILSSEAIQAIQSLKRAHKLDGSNLPVHDLSRLLKSDLTAAIKELLRQDQCSLARVAFSTLRSEYGADLNMYAELVLCFARNGLVREIDSLIAEMENDDVSIGETKGLLRLVTAVIGARRMEPTVRIYRMMKRSGSELDEYLGRVMSKGLRNFGEVDLANEVDEELKRLYRGIFV